MGRGAGSGQVTDILDRSSRPSVEQIIAQKMSGCSWEEIAQELAQSGFRTSRGEPSRDYVRRLVADAAAEGNAAACEALAAPPVRRSGPGIGRPAAVSDRLRSEVVTLYNQTRNLAEVKRLLEERGVAAPRGGSTWYLATIRDIVKQSGDETLAGGWFQEEALGLIERRLVGTSKNQRGRRKNQEKLARLLNRLGYPATKEGEPWTYDRVSKAVRRHGLSPAIQSRAADLETEELIVNAVADRGLTLEEAAAELNHAGVGCPWGENGWQSKTVARVLNMRRRRLRP